MNTNVKIKSLDHFGRGISHIEGKVVFIKNTLPGEEVEIKITNTKKNYLEGDVEKYISQSKSRIIPECPYYGICGGCDISHISYKEQINFKKEKFENILKIDNPEVIPSNKEKNYRNKISLKVKDSVWGYNKEKSHLVVEIDNCLLAKKSINKLLESKKLFNIENGEVVIRSNYNDELLISISSSKKVKIDINNLIIDNKIAGIIVNDRIVYGKNYFLEVINGYTFKVNYKSFFQVNLDILSKVFDILKINKYKNIVDLYCGVGSLGIAVNKEKLWGIEEADSSVKDAIYNAKINNQKNNFYIKGDSSTLSKIEERIDLLIVDPPRSGISKETINNILESNIPKVIYMSCDPHTLSRDLKILQDKYEVEKSYLLDIFPETYHVESIIVLNIK